MPWLPAYMDLRDADDVVAWFNADPEIAFIVRAGPPGAGTWRAIAELDHVAEGQQCLWHVPSGPLPLLNAGPPRFGPPGVIDGEWIADPWSGWTERRQGADANLPYFGPGHVGVIWWDLGLYAMPDPAALPISGFQWVGNRKRELGVRCHESTMRWWNRLRSRTKKVAVKVPRSGPLDGPHPEIWAFPSALRGFREGKPRAGQ